MSAHQPLRPELGGDVVTDLLTGETVGSPISFEVQRILYSLGPPGQVAGRGVLLTLRFAPGSRLEVLRVPLEHEDAARLAEMLSKHAAIVARQLAAEGS